MLTIKFHNYTQEDTDTLLWSIQYLLMEVDKGHTPLAPASHADLTALTDFLTTETQTGYPHCYNPRTPRSKTDFVNNDFVNNDSKTDFVNNDIVNN